MADYYSSCSDTERRTPESDDEGQNYDEDDILEEDYDGK